jgi:histidinol dehydrogenase/phosphoribosyl-ATP pyrophosphohydrolase
MPESWDEVRDPWSPKRKHQTTQCVVPSIDLINGHAVQLVGGDPNELKIDAGDPIPVLHRFRLAGEVAVIDLDAALSRGSNETVVRKLLSQAPCRVGGGIRTVERALQYLNWGAQRVIIGTAAKPELLKQLPRDRVIVALDSRHGEVVVDGWQTKTGRGVAERIEELKQYAGGFLVTFVEREGRMQGIDLAAVRRLAKLCGEGEFTSRLCVAGGITTAEEVRALDRMGVEGQVGMALYSGRLPLAEALLAPVSSERADGLMPTVVVDEQERCLGLVYSSPESVAASVASLRGVYWSRKRGLWEKGLTSGAYQELVTIRTDCDRDALQFVVRQHGIGFCHLETYSCFGQRRGIAGLMHTLEQRCRSAPAGSYTKRLYDDPVFLKSKLVEEAHELGDASTKVEVAAEAADVLYFALVACARTGVTIADVERVLDQRALKVSRRPGNAKPQHDQSKKQQQPACTAVAEPEITAAAPPSATTAAEAIPAAAVVEARVASAPASVSSSSSSTCTTPEPRFADEAPADEEEEEEPNAPLLRRLRAAEVPRGRRIAYDARSAEIAQGIVKDVQTGGLEALLEHAVRLGDLPSAHGKLTYTRLELEEAFRSLDRDTRQLLCRTGDRIKAFAKAQRNSLHAMRISVPGGRAGHLVTPVVVAGCYAPGGRYPLPSSVLMTALTARVAGCATVWVASPHPQVVTLAAAHVAGADGLLAVGGAQAIAALAHGVRDPNAPDRWLVPACDAVVGPGNRFVTAAKQAVAGIVQIEGLAGPSELLVVADEHADASVVAADLIGQAEHDPCAVPILISLSEELVDRVDAELRAQLRVLPTAVTARLAFTNNSAALVVRSIQEAAELSDMYAPEHLEVQTRNAHADAKLFQHFGALFIGSAAAEVFGDYGAGPNHTLPTGGTARSTGGLSVLTFLRVRTFLEIEDVATAEAQLLTRDAAALARLEGLHGHAASASKRLRALDADTQQAIDALSFKSDSESELGSFSGSEVLTDPSCLPPPSLSEECLASTAMRLAIAKGRMFDNVAALLCEAGVNMSVGGRSLRPTIDIPNWDIKLLKPRNVVEMLHLGSRDVGFAGTDLLEELAATNVVPYFNTALDPVGGVVCLLASFSLPPFCFFWILPDCDPVLSCVFCVLPLCVCGCAFFLSLVDRFVFSVISVSSFCVFCVL